MNYCLTSFLSFSFLSCQNVSSNRYVTVLFSASGNCCGTMRVGCEIIVISLFTAGRHSVISKDARWSIFGAVTGPVTMMGEHFVSVYILAVYAPCRRGYRCAAAGAAMTYNPPPGPGARDKGFARVHGGAGEKKAHVMQSQYENVCKPPIYCVWCWLPSFYWGMEEIGVLVSSELVSYTSVGLASSRLESFIYT